MRAALLCVAVSAYVLPSSRISRPRGVALRVATEDPATVADEAQAPKRRAAPVLTDARDMVQVFEDFEADEASVVSSVWTRRGHLWIGSHSCCPGLSRGRL